MTEPATDIVSGRTIAERYRLERKLGSGGMSSVWLATDLTLGSPVALKFIHAEMAIHPEVRARFYTEARAAAALRSPHVVQTLDYGVDKDVPFIAMELLEGESLATRLEIKRTLTPDETARIFADVGRAVRKAHEAGIVHRDLKPDNIFLVKNDDQEIAKVLDFGIAKITNAHGAQRGATRTGVLLGTLPYMSPEQAQGRAIDPRTDLWALGVIAFECLTGKRPFDSDSAGELIVQICAHPIPVPSQVASVPVGFDAWFAKAATRDAGGRFQSVKELVDGLRAVLVPDASRMSLPDATTSSAALPRISVPDNAASAAAGAAAATAPGPIVTMAGAAMDRRQSGAPRPVRSRILLAISIAAGALTMAPIAWLVTRPSPTPIQVAAQAAAPDAVSATPSSPVTVAPATNAIAATAAPSADPVTTAAPAAEPTAEPTGAAQPAAKATTSATAKADPPVARREPEPRAKAQDKPANPPPARPPAPAAAKRGKDSRIGF